MSSYRQQYSGKQGHPLKGSALELPRMKEFKTKKSQETYRRVLDSAIALFTEKSYEKTTMRAISQRSKLGLGALYYYFPSKESIVTSFYAQINREISAEWSSQTHGTEELGPLLESFVSFKLTKLEPYRALLRIILKEAVDPESPLSPLSSESSEPLESNLEIFESMLEPSESRRQIAKLLWLGHLALIGLWIHKPDKVGSAITAYAELAPFLSLTVNSGSLGPWLDDLIP